MIVKRKPKPLFIIIIFIIIVFFGLGVSWIYLSSPVDKNNAEDIEIEIVSGTRTSQIGNILKEKNLIKSKLMFMAYIKIYNIRSLKASVYKLNQSMGMKEIVKTLEDGSSYNPNLVKLTFKEGLRITDYAKVISDNTNNSYEEVINTFKDLNYIKTLIPNYWFLTDGILNNNIYYPLEGYLAPDTYYFENKDVKVNDIIIKMLDEMNEKLSKYKDKLSTNIHYYLTMASIVELEGTNIDNRRMIVGVFNNRLQSGMNLGSDVTTYYGAQVAMTSDLTSEQFASVNAYNTRSITMIGKMPVGPICNFSDSSIEASINPEENNYLFFVADKNGNIYYTKTNIEHDKKVAEIKAKGDWIW